MTCLARAVLYRSVMKKTQSKKQPKTPPKTNEISLDQMRAIIGGVENAREEMRK